MTDDQPDGGQTSERRGVQLELANAVVRLQKEYVGRGATKARAYIRDDLVVVMLRESLTKAEHSLVAAGKDERVLGIRRDFQRAMRDDLVDAVETITGRKVIAFMSDNHLDPDIGAEIFALEPATGDTEAVTTPLS